MCTYVVSEVPSLHIAQFAPQPTAYLTISHLHQFSYLR